MPTFQTTRRVLFTPSQMYDLVADVEKYPLFLPMCESIVVREREATPQGTRLIATMGVGYGTLRESFTSRVTLLPIEHRIVVEYLDGPFSHLENRWGFVPAAQGADVDFWISYEFRSVMLGMLMGAVFDKAFRRFIAAFEQRAGVVYGTGVATPAA